MSRARAGEQAGRCRSGPRGERALASAEQRLRQAELDRATAQALADEAKAKATAERRTRRLSLALAGALLIGGIAAGWQAVVANRANQDAMTAAALEKDAMIAAEAKEAENSSGAGIRSKTHSRSGEAGGPGGGLGYDVTLRKAFEAALPFLDKSFANQPLTEARLRMTLGKSFFDLGDRTIAATQYQRARTIYTELLGPEHSETLASMNNLALSYVALGRHADALILNEETVAILRAKLGGEHLNTLAAMNNLAISYSALSRHDDALKLREETLAICKTALGPEHSTTLTGMNNLARSYSAVGRHADALKLREELLPIMKTTQGVNHPQTLLSMNNLASSYYWLARYEDAAKLAVETLAAATQARRRPPRHVRDHEQLGRYYHAARPARRSRKLGEDVSRCEPISLAGGSAKRSSASRNWRGVSQPSADTRTPLDSVKKRCTCRKRNSTPTTRRSSRTSGASPTTW